MTLNAGKGDLERTLVGVSLRVSGKGWRLLPCAPCPGDKTRVGGWDSLGAVERGREFRTWRRFREEKTEAVISLPPPFTPLLMIQPQGMRFHLQLSFFPHPQALLYVLPLTHPLGRLLPPEWEALVYDPTGQVLLLLEEESKQSGHSSSCCLERLPSGAAPWGQMVSPAHDNSRSSYSV